IKSTSRPGSSMLVATVESSSDSVGEPATICWNKVSTLRCSASTSESLSGIRQPHALQAFGKYEEALIGHLDDFVHHRQGSDGVEVAWLWRVDACLALRYHHDG